MEVCSPVGKVRPAILTRYSLIHNLDLRTIAENNLSEDNIYKVVG